MLAIKFTFTANRYHATQWGRHVNEGVLEWPPSPWRILRGVVATWQRTRPDLAPDRVVPVLEALAAERPRFKLPDGSTGHTRHYMPYNEGARERSYLGHRFVHSNQTQRPRVRHVAEHGIDLAATRGPRQHPPQYALLGPGRVMGGSRAYFRVSRRSQLTPYGDWSNS